MRVMLCAKSPFNLRQHQKIWFTGFLCALHSNTLLWCCLSAHFLFPKLRFLVTVDCSIGNQRSWFFPQYMFAKRGNNKWGITYLYQLQCPLKVYWLLQIDSKFYVFQKERNRSSNKCFLHFQLETTCMRYTHTFFITAITIRYSHYNTCM